MDFSSSSINKNSFIFLEKAFLIFRETETPPPPPPKKSCIPGNGAFLCFTKRKPERK